MSCRRSERLNHRSPSHVLGVRGCVHGRGHGGGRAAARTTLKLKEEVPPAGEQHMEEPILEEPGAAESSSLVLVN